jgi:uncharacterized protein
MRAILVAALLLGATGAYAQSSPAKKELVARLVQTQQAGFEGVARNIVERPALQMMQAAEPVLARLPADKREATARQVQTEIRKFVDEATPLLRERAVRLAPSTYGAALEERFSEDELRQLLAWLESPVNKKYQQALPELQNTFVQKLITDGASCSACRHRPPIAPVRPGRRAPRPRRRGRPRSDATICGSPWLTHRLRPSPICSPCARRSMASTGNCSRC